ncbi:hypothetical protein BDN71DRAFT_1449348 [Pleurotus eryngii]|uniref:Uncharacterized protein n=1 Tax=Pleurotus eryngii TaxID=5323 RepID=A0A9P6DEL8_PLEER|nr:hypothetical protein BDN71DRAFT_1449348 [Pleurotus eryngii]
MDSYPEPLEQAFQRVEAEAERRVQEELAAAKRNTGAPVAAFAAEVRRRGSISYSKLGELAAAGLNSGPPMSVIPASKANFYGDQLNRSFDSFSSAHLGQDADVEEDDGITQLHIIGGRQSTSIAKAVGSLLPRKLSRASEANMITNVVIGVSVEEAAILESQEQQPVAGAVVSGPIGPRGQKLGSAESFLLGWVGRVRSAAQRFCRKGTSFS